MGTNVFYKGMRAMAVLGLVLAVGACGVKSSPQFPEGSTYPRTYPAAGPERGTASPSSETAPDKTRESDRDARSPLGFPLEYPNRSSYQ